MNDCINTVNGQIVPCGIIPAGAIDLPTPKLQILSAALTTFLSMFNPSANRDSVALINYGSTAAVGQPFQTAGGFNNGNACNDANCNIIAALNANSGGGGQTNASDGFRVAWGELQNFLQTTTMTDDNGNPIQGVDVAWVFFTDGNPTSGVFNFNVPGSPLHNIPLLSERMLVADDNNLYNLQRDLLNAQNKKGTIIAKDKRLFAQWGQLSPNDNCFSFSVDIPSRLCNLANYGNNGCTVPVIGSNHSLIGDIPTISEASDCNHLKGNIQRFTDLNVQSTLINAGLPCLRLGAGGGCAVPDMSFCVPSCGYGGPGRQFNSYFNPVGAGVNHLNADVRNIAIEKVEGSTSDYNFYKIETNDDGTKSKTDLNKSGPLSNLVTQPLINFGGDEQLFMKAYYYVAVAWTHFVRSLVGDLVNGIRINSSRVYVIGLGNFVNTTPTGVPWNTRINGTQNGIIAPNSLIYGDDDKQNYLTGDVWNQNHRKDTLMSAMANDYGTSDGNKMAAFPVVPAAAADNEAIATHFLNQHCKEADAGTGTTTCGEYHPIVNAAAVDSVFISIARKIQLSLVR
jgi:hypothetical protein